MRNKTIIILILLFTCCPLSAQSEASILRQLEKSEQMISNGEYSSAIARLSELMKKTRKKYGGVDEATSACLYLLSVAQKGIGDYTGALQSLNEEKEITLELFGYQSAEYAASLYSISECHEALFNYDSAVSYAKAAVDIYSKIEGYEPEALAQHKSDLAVLYSTRGDQETAIELMAGVLDYYNSIGDNNSLDYAVYLGNLSAFYLQDGDYSSSLRHCDKALHILNDLSLENTIEYAYILCYKSNVYESLGFLAEAISCIEEALPIFIDTLGEKSSEYASALDNLSVLLMDSGDPEKALSYSLNALKLREEVIGIDDPLYAYSLNNLSHIYSELKDYEKAIEYGRAVVEYRKEHSYNDLLYATSLTNLAEDLQKKGNYQEALSLIKEALSIRESQLNEWHPDILNSYYALANVCFTSGDIKEAERIVDKYLSSFSNLVVRSFTRLKESEREQYWDKLESVLQDVIYYGYASPSDGFLKAAYDAALLEKALLLTSTTEFRKSILKRNDPSLVDKYNVLLGLRREVETLEENNSDNALSELLADRSKKADDLENELLDVISTDGDMMGFLSIKMNDVRAKLNEKSVAIEFLVSNHEDTNSYYALILRDSWDVPKMVKIAPEQTLERYSRQGSKLYSGFLAEEAYETIWDPISPYISTGDTVFFSPVGILHQINLEDLVTSHGADAYTLDRVSSTRILCSADRDSFYPRKAVIYGGLQYEIDNDDLMNLHQMYSLNSTRGNDSFIGEPGTRSGWSYLPGTELEADSIVSQFESRGIEAKVYKTVYGTEESIKSLSGDAPSIIHLATHGFYLKSNDAEKQSYYNRINDKRLISNPLRRSGLILSGGQNAWLGKEVPIGVEDGILTSEEISHLDLSGTDLLVLSACQSGLGDLSKGEVFGLQRAFKAAGVNTIIMSLWEIDDKATTMIMTSFYKQLLDGYSPRTALSKAKDEVKQTMDDPYYWASFIILD